MLLYLCCFGQRGSFVKDGKSFEVEPTEIPNGNEGKRNIGQDFNAHVHTIRAMDENSTHSLDFGEKYFISDWINRMVNAEIGRCHL